jgi:GpV Apex motif
MTVAASAYLGGVSGQGGGVATMIPPGNLTALAFLPLGNVSFFTVNGQILTMYGPGGVTLMDQGQTTFFNLTPGQIAMMAGGHNVTISSVGVVIDGIVFGTHEHTGVEGGTGQSGGPVAP